MSDVIDIHTDGCCNSREETTDGTTTIMNNNNNDHIQNDLCQTSTTTPTTNESKDKSDHATNHNNVDNISSSVVAAPTTSETTAMTTITQQQQIVWEKRVQLVRQHFIQKGYRVHSGLQFGCELVLYADDPSRVHSDFCVHVVPEDGRLDWKSMQTLVRSMPDFHKTLILANVRKVNVEPTNQEQQQNQKFIIIKKAKNDNDKNNSNNTEEDNVYYVVDEIAMATEHAPFRHKKASERKLVGTQTKNNNKKQRCGTKDKEEGTK